jgi:hypothetical protein
MFRRTIFGAGRNLFWRWSRHNKSRNKNCVNWADPPFLRRPIGATTPAHYLRQAPLPLSKTVCAQKILFLNLSPLRKNHSERLGKEASEGLPGNPP